MSKNFLYFILFFLLAASLVPDRPAQCTESALTKSSPEKDRVHFREEVLNLKNAPKTYRKIILENSKIQISILPELGGRIYEFIPKEGSRKNQFYTNSVWKRVKDWGVNSIRKEGNWLAIGGIEYSFPTEEHGSIYDHPVQPIMSENPQGGKSVEFTFPPAPQTRGLSLTVHLRINPGEDYLEIHSKVSNPKGNRNQKYQYWINCMLNPGGLDPRDADLKVIFPKSMANVVTHYGNKLGPEARAKYPWPREFENFDFWKSGVVGFFTESSVPYVALVSAKAREGVIRIQTRPSYQKIWNFGPPLDFSMFSDTNRVYVESWSGVSKNFWTDSEIRGGERVEVTEYWMPITVNETAPDLIRKEIEEKIKKNFPRSLAVD